VVRTAAGMPAIRVFENDGAGAFTFATDLFLQNGGDFVDLQLVDLNGDGPLDIIVTLANGTIAVLHGTGVAP